MTTNMAGPRNLSLTGGRVNGNCFRSVAGDQAFDDGVVCRCLPIVPIGAGGSVQEVETSVGSSVASVPDFGGDNSGGNDHSDEGQAIKRSCIGFLLRRLLGACPQLIIAAGWEILKYH